MNKDFHFEGTYCAARIAGFPHGDAEKIAWAAQMVDDCTETLLDHTGISASFQNTVITCETTWDSAKDDIKYGEYAPKTNTTLQKIRSIWMPFHFLPGNLGPGRGQVYTGEQSWGGFSFDADIDANDFLCLCLHNSDLAQEMIDDTISCYAAPPAQYTRDILLYLIGIRMHVLADTWAHEFFAGTPNYWINDIDGLEVENSDIAEYGKSRSLPGVTFHSVFYHGHGRLGHLPDLGYLSYQYIPRWLGSPIIKNNTGIFTRAFCQMADALTAIQTNQPFRQNEYSTDMDIRGCLGQYCDTICDLLSRKKAGSDENDWSSLVSQFPAPNVPVYNAANAGVPEMIAFQTAALRHRDMVCNKLHNSHIAGF